MSTIQRSARRRRIVLPLCGLVLAASLASCAPTVTAPTGEQYRPQVAPRDFLNDLIYRPIPLQDVTPETPDTAWVLLPTCPDAILRAGDVRKLGTEEASRVCKTTTQARGTFNLVMNVLGTIVLIPALWFVYYIGSFGFLRQ